MPAPDHEPGDESRSPILREPLRSEALALMAEAERLRCESVALRAQSVEALAYLRALQHRHQVLRAPPP